MPKHLALLLCFGFILYALKYDRRQRTQVTKAMWLPTLWILAIAGKSLDVWFGSIGGATIDPIFYTVLLCLGVRILVKRNFKWSAISQKYGWLSLLLVLMLVSILWCDDPFVLFKRFIRELTGVVMALIITTEVDPPRAVEHVLRRSVYVLIPLSIVLIKYFPYLGVVYGRWSGEIQWVGVTIQKNGLGRLCDIAAFYLLWTLIRRWKGKDKALDRYHTYIDVLMLGITAWLLKGPSIWAASATAIYSLGFGLIVFFGMTFVTQNQIKINRGIWVALIAVIIGFGILTPLVGGATVGAFTSAVGRDSTLTGRIQIWASLLPDIANAPLLGYGFNSFWNPVRAWTHDIYEAHNGYVEVTLGLGCAGLFLTCMFLLSTAKQAARLLRYNPDWAIFTLCFLVIATVHNITESSFDSFTRHLMGMVLFLSMSLIIPARSKVRAQVRREPSQGGVQYAPPVTGSVSKKGRTVPDPVF